jgi:hypothetical protein
MYAPLYRIRRLLTMAKEKLTESANDQLTRFLEARDPDNEVPAGEPRNPYESSIPIVTQNSPETTSMPSSVTSPTTNDLARSNYLGEPCEAGMIRS